MNDSIPEDQADEPVSSTPVRTHEADLLDLLAAGTAGNRALLEQTHGFHPTDTEEVSR